MDSGELAHGVRAELDRLIVGEGGGEEHAGCSWVLGEHLEGMQVGREALELIGKPEHRPHI